MSRTAMNILTVILIIALAIWAIYTYKACQEQKKPVETAVNTTETTDNDPYEAPDTANLDDLYEDTSEDDTAGDDTVEDTNEPEEETGSEITSSNGDFLIIVGAYQLRERSEKVVNRLRQLGYNAERRVFLSSDYHSVVVGNYEDLNEAYRVTKKIIDTGYPDAYVHKKRMLKKKS